jgi:hypothetical protein
VLWDLSYILENAYRISLGQVPYRDFPFPYAPLTFLTQAAIIKVTGRVYFHHVIYCAVVGGIGTVITWRILLHVFREAAYGRLLALVVTSPLTVLGIYDIFPHPFYDPDCTFAILICLLLLLNWRETPAFGKGLVCGVTLFLPTLIKQNVGLAFLGAALTTILLLVAVDRRQATLRKYVPFVAGLVLTSGLALLLIQHAAGLDNYIQWTIKFAAQRRTPAFHEMIGVYANPALKWWLVLVGVALVVQWKSHNNRLLLLLSRLAMIVPFFWPVIYLVIDSDSSERAERLVNLWPLLLILSVVALITNVRRKSRTALLLMPIVGVTVHGAFTSQQLWGSTYALWPFFLILVAILIKTVGPSINRGLADGTEQGLSIATAVLISASLIIPGFFYMRSHERLGYANLDDGELTHSNLAALKGLATRGSWFPDFEELVAYTNKEIPIDAGILYLPGEDLFYYTTGRSPQFPVLMFDHTVNPYSPKEILNIARARDIQFLIVKDELQLEEEPLQRKEELMNLLMQDFESVESLENYEIYQRKSAESEDSEDDDDDTSPKMR